MKTARFSFARALLNCSERSAGSHGLDRAKSCPDCSVTWPKGRKIGELGREGIRKTVRRVSIIGIGIAIIDRVQRARARGGGLYVSLDRQRILSVKEWFRPGDQGAVALTSGARLRSDE